MDNVASLRLYMLTGYDESVSRCYGKGCLETKSQVETNKASTSTSRMMFRV